MGTTIYRFRFRRVDLLNHVSKLLFVNSTCFGYVGRATFVDIQLACCNITFKLLYILVTKKIYSNSQNYLCLNLLRVANAVSRIYFSPSAQAENCSGASFLSKCGRYVEALPLTNVLRKIEYSACYNFIPHA